MIREHHLPARIEKVLDLEFALNFLTLHDNAYKKFGFHSSLNINKRSIFFSFCRLGPANSVRYVYENHLKS